MEREKRLLLKKTRNYLKPLKLQQIIKICHKKILQHCPLNNIKPPFKKVSHAVRNSKLFRI